MGVRARLVLVTAVLAATTAVAHADGWYFEWVCSGACAPHHLDSRGVDGPFGSQSDCERARTQRRFESNQADMAGTASECYSSDSASGARPANPFAGARPAVLARAYLAALYAGTWSVSRSDGSTGESGATA